MATKSSSSKRREQQRQDVREKVLAAARELLLAEGAEGFSMRKLAARIGYTPTALYYHFRDKEAVLRELMDADCQALRNGVDSASGIADPIERIRTMGVGYVEFAFANPDHYRILFMTEKSGVVMDPNNPRRGDPAQDGYALLHQAVADALAAKRFRPEYTDALQLTQIIWAGVHGIVSLHLVLGHEPWFDWRPARPTAQMLIDIMIRGLVASGT